MVHGHPVVDTDKHFIIDPVTRAVTNAEQQKTILMQFDHNSERFSFEIDKLVEGHDMTLCNKVEIHYINIDSSTRVENEGVYEVEDLQIAESDDSKVVFTWLISGNATFNPGPLNFLIMFACEKDGEVIYRWHTDINTSMSITAGMNNGEAIIDLYPDILFQWKQRLFAKNYPYDAAVRNGYEGTEEEWNEILMEWARNNTLWPLKQNKLGWIEETDIDAMFEGDYVGTEDEESEGSYGMASVSGETLVVNGVDS